MHSARDVRPPPGSRFLALVGPTAVGKTALALKLAAALDAEIISVDSMQVYRGMDIGTSKPPACQRLGVPVHLLDVADPTAEFSVAAFKELADRAAVDVLKRRKVPFLVGGSGLYYRAVVDDLDFAGAGPADGPDSDGESEELADAELHRLLADVDPLAAREIPPQNRRRVLKALDVARRGERLISRRQRSWSEFSSPYDLRAAGLDMDRALLYRLIDERVEYMLEAGLQSEVEGLRDAGLRTGTTAGEAIGYRQMLDFLEGRLAFPQLVTEIKSRTHSYARRQLTWFRKDPRIEWFRLEAGASDTPETVARALDGLSGPVLEYLSSKQEN